jgi:hypothetical protein
MLVGADQGAYAFLFFAKKINLLYDETRQDFLGRKRG